MSPAPRPLVTVVVPARNEERDIERCLGAIAAQDYEPHRIELLVVNGASTDATAAKASEAIERLGFHNARILHNPFATTPSNLNIGLARATGEILCRVDARSLIPPTYVSRCVELLRSRDDVSVVGGRQRAVPPSDGSVGLGIARALNNRWGMGLSRYRRGAASGPSDTVYLGAFRASQLRAVGGWDERLGTNQDFDLNRRMSRYGLVWFDARLTVGYVPRPDLSALFRQYRRFGRSKVRYWRLTRDLPRPRQLVLAGSPLVLACGIGVLVRRPGWTLPALAGAALGASAIEVLGADAPDTRSPSAHLVGMAGMATVAAGWLLGVWAELVRGENG
jgi:succinoglycan biosynthesis protein ExoA